jgi:hypothetical protein
MISILCGGKLIAKPAERTSKAGKPYATIQFVTETQDATILVSGIAFDAEIVRQLLALEKGDSVAVTGPCKPSAWVKEFEPVAGLSVTITALLTPYAIKRKQAAGDGPRVGLPAERPAFIGAVDEDDNGAAF